MDFAFNPGQEFATARLILKAILLSLLGIFHLIAFIAARRWHRARYFRRLSERTLALRSQWNGILDGTVCPRTWRLNRLDCELVEAMLLDSMEAANAEQLPALLACLRSSGLLDLRIHQARSSVGWRQRSALVALGRTRAVEAVAALEEALDSPATETRIAAARGLGRTGLPQAAVAILDHLLSDGLPIPEYTVKNALANCCRHSPQTLLPYLKDAGGPARTIVARVLAELATPALGEDLIVLATDGDAEVRASAARAMGASQASFALPVLSVLVRDQEWFVRLRAVVALSSIQEPGRIRPLLRALCDSNRYVRQRAAWALSQMGSDLEQILYQVVDTEDGYALQAFVSELERTGTTERLLEVLHKSGDSAAAAQILLQAIANSRKELSKSVERSAAAAGGR
jgi:HEAT repeat protein